MALYELRIYRCHPGKLEELLNRFRQHTVALFEKHGMENVGYWIPSEEKEQTLYYVLRHTDKAACEASWSAFEADPDWQEVVKKSNGKIVSEITSHKMTLNTTLSPAPKWSAAPAPRLFEMRIYKCFPGKYPALIQRFKDHALSLFEKHGMTNIAYFDTEDGTLLYFRTHPDAETAAKSFKAFRSDPQWLQVVEDSEREGKIVDNMTGLFLIPVDFSSVQ